MLVSVDPPSVRTGDPRRKRGARQRTDASRATAEYDTQVSSAVTTAIVLAAIAPVIHR